MMLQRYPVTLGPTRPTTVVAGLLLVSLLLGGWVQPAAARQALPAVHPSQPVALRHAWTPPAPGFPRTAGELSGFQRPTSHTEMWDFLSDLRNASTVMRLGTYGTTWEGRELPYAVFSQPLVSQPWEAWALGRPIVLLAANVHGGERTFREGLLILMRDLATPGTEANLLLDRVTVLVAPQMNPDGYEATERGIRGNAWGIDLNRDYVKLEHPEIASYVENLLAAWRPHMFVDSHNGGSRPYNLTYQCPSHYDPAQEITHLCDREIFPAIDARLARESLRTWYYSGGDEEAWRVGGNQARIGRNYGGFINAVGILFEAPGQDQEDGARAGYLGNLAVLEYAVRNAGRLTEVVDAARLETMVLGADPSGEIAVEMEYAPEDYLVSYTFIRGGPGRGGAPDTPVDTIEVTGAQILKKPVATKTRPRPWAYVLPRDAREAVAMLRRHGITVEVLTDSAALTVDVYTVAGVTHERAYNHAAATRVEVGEVLTETRTFPAGTYVVPTSQFLGRLVAHMLEPETDDNVVYWNTMDAWIPRPRAPGTGQELPEGMDPDNIPPEWAARMAAQQAQQGPPTLPIYKLMAPTPLPARLMGEGR
jgi:dipeptidyl-peptidase 4